MLLSCVFGCLECFDDGWGCWLSVPLGVDSKVYVILVWWYCLGCGFCRIYLISGWRVLVL